MNLQYIRIYTLTYFQPVFVDISRDSLGIHNLSSAQYSKYLFILHNTRPISGRNCIHQDDL